MNVKETFALLVIIVAGLVCVTSCVGTEGPLNIEPELVAAEAYDITHTEATISAEIKAHGAGSLSYLHFNYGEDEETQFKTEDIPNPSGTVSIRLTGLKPGTTYCYHATGGTPTARIISQSLTFTTLPNRRPSVSEATILESGPTAVIVGFSITSDGGEQITEAGCRVRDIAANTDTVFQTNASSIKEGDIRLLIAPLSMLTEYEIIPFATNRVGTGNGEPLTFATENAVRLSNPGNLSALIGDAPFKSESISIMGKMNGDDFRFLRRLLNAPPLPGESPGESLLKNVYITGVEIAEGGGTYDGSRFTKEGVISTGMFADCPSLSRVSLPLSATSIERNAFGNCLGLQSLTISPGISTVLPSEGCVSLCSIEVSEANPCFRSLDGVLLNYESTEIMWFPLGKTGHYLLPTSVTEIGENAFCGAKIASVFLHDGLTHIGRGAFAKSSLEEICLPDGLTNLYEATFQECLSLKKVILGTGIQYLGDYMFDGCPLQDIHIHASIPPYVTSGCFTGDSHLYGSCTLHVPSGARKTYRAHPVWGKFETITED